MKTSSGYQLETPMHKMMQASYQMNLNTSFLTNINVAIMKKLTSISPFLLLLVPVFVMMVISITTQTADQNETALRSAQHNNAAKTAVLIKQ